MPVTRRDFLTGSALAAVAGVVGRPAILGAWQATAPAAAGQQTPAITPVFTEIRRNVGWFTGRGGAIGYLVNTGGVVVVDSQYRDSAKVFLDGLNQRSKNRPVDFLVNTHHHGDHTDGNIAFKGVARKVVAQAKAAEMMRSPPGLTAPTVELLFPDTTFPETWSASVGDERMSAKFYGPAHTSGDVVVTFERANIAHMGDLAFNQRHPIVDRAAGASIKNWMAILARVPKDHTKDTTYIFGHANTNLPITGDESELARLHDYFGALLAFVESQVRLGKTREEILAMRDPLKGFETFGRFPNANARDPLTVAYEELTAK